MSRSMVVVLWPLFAFIGIGFLFVYLIIRSKKKREWALVALYSILLILLSIYVVFAMVIPLIQLRLNPDIV
ncbi:MAG: hypothetical protein ACFFCS_15730 [Candidatus Hodarchaeota archaeon]